MAKPYTGPGTQPPTQTKHTITTNRNPTGDAAQYPKYVYNKDGAVLVTSKEAHEALEGEHREEPFEPEVPETE